MLTCNIDRRGRKMRSVAGGMIMIIEGAIGWRALRALGVKTPV